ncbi:MAG: carboxypeptidase-like regulatory domain-containing protein, partial [Candidatus Halalkalibacterium sp. M3_1C_030]
MTDSSKVVIPYVQIILYDSTNTKIVDFTQGDSLGNYQLSGIEPGYYNLAFNILSHKPITFPLLFSNSDSLMVLDVTLSPLPLMLNEIVVQSERSIRVSGDTIAMKVGDFIRGDEEVVEDVLKVLPGFDVDDDGTIRFAGKQITKVMIEGSDLFGKGYSMITKNLDANVLEDVEVLQNYTELSELRGLEKSDDIALNLSLKEEVKFELFGNASLGINTLERHEARLVLTSLNKRFKQFLFLNSNSLGKDPLGELNQFAGMDNTGFTSDNLIDIEITPRDYLGRSLLPLSARRMRFNNSGLASYSAIYKPNNDFEFKIISVGRFDKDKLNRQIELKFLTEELISRDLETLNLTDKIDSGILKLESIFKPNFSSRLEYEGFLKLDKSSAYASIFITDESFIEDFRTSIWETSHYVNYINR